MRSRGSEIALRTASFGAFAFALALSVPLVERLAAATWQSYKFVGYADSGYISLSLKTGLLFSGLLAALFACAFMLNRAARRCSSDASYRWSSRAMFLVSAIAVSYWMLGISSLNAWRA